jgi:glycosyltransferase involved in cell wall biosynthesis
MNDLDSTFGRELIESSRAAVVHDWLYTYAGAERVLEQIIALAPHADIFSIVDFLPDDARRFLRGKTVNTSVLQRFPFARRKHRQYLPLMPLLVEQFDLDQYELVISSSHAVAKGVLTGADQLHISYVHSPMRYAWDLHHQYLRAAGLGGWKGWLARWILHRLRLWDLRTANGVDHFIANSQFIARRIRKIYRRRATVIYPPVDVACFTSCERKEPFYLTASRFVPYKRIDLIVEAFTSMPNRKLIVIGEGPEERNIKGKAGRNVEVLGYQTNEVLTDYMRRAKAFVFAAEEDFGIVPVEAQACGTPVIAYGRGGVTETVRPLGMLRPTGILFPEQSVQAIVESVSSFEREQEHFLAHHCRLNAERFSVERFGREFATFVATALDRFRSFRARRTSVSTRESSDDWNFEEAS